MGLPAFQDDFFEKEPPKVYLSNAWWVAELQKDWWSKVIGITGGLGSGKTHGAVQWHYARCTENQNSPFSWFVEPIFARIKDTALPKWRKFFQAMGFREGVHFIVRNGHPTVIKLSNGHEVHLISAHNPDLMVGAEISHATIDEAGSVKYDAYLNVMSRLRCPAARRRQVLLPGAPQGTNWFADNFDFKGFDKLKRYRRIQLWTDDNLHNLPDDYVQQLVETWRAFPLKIKSYRYGEFTPFYEGTCVTEFSEATDVDAEVAPDPALDLYLTWDFNAYPLAWCALQVQPFLYNYRGRVHRIRKYVAIAESSGQLAGHLGDACAEFVKKFPPNIYGNTPLRIYGDRTGHAKSHKVSFTDYQQIASYLGPYYKDIEVCAQGKITPQVEGIEELNRLFSYDLFTVHPRCQNLINGFKQTKWKPGTRDIEKKQGETHTHWLDAVKYLCFQLKSLDILSAKRQIVFGLNR